MRVQGMKTIDRFILKAYLGPMILTFFIVLFVIMMNFMWRFIDQLVGKGLDGSIIAELMMYAAITFIPMALPLATLLAALMTMGNLGENYELLAMKSCGMSLPRIMKPLTIMIGVIAIGSFFIANDLVPWAQLQMDALRYDIRKQKQELEFKDGLFFNEIDGMSIRIGRQHQDTKLLDDVLIYDYSDARGNMSTTIADSGYIRTSDDKRFLLVTLYEGQRFEHTRGSQWLTEPSLQRQDYNEHNQVVQLTGFDLSRTDSELFTGSSSKNIVQLERGIDSLNNLMETINKESLGPFMQEIFVNDRSLVVDSLRGTMAHEIPVNLTDSLERLSIPDKQRLWSSALSSARASKNSFSYEEERSKNVVKQLYLHKTEWHRKLSLPVSIMIFFLIGAPLGAIIRRGGLGMPIVVSVVFFVIYYIISMSGEKLAKEGSWSSFSGMWLSTFILLPIAVFLVYKATNDSNLFNAEWYFGKLKQIKEYFNKFKKAPQATTNNGTGQ